MSIDRSLRSASSLERHRNVLTRTERVALLKNEDRWPEDGSPLGLPKVGHRKVKTAGKTKKEVTEDSEEAPEAKK